MTHSMDMYVGGQLRAARTMRGLSQKEVAQRLGISFQQVQKYETGVNRIAASRLFALATLLKVSPSFFFEGMEGHGAVIWEPLALDKETLRAVRHLSKIRNHETRRQLLSLIKAVAAHPDALIEGAAVNDGRVH
ncbi:MAG: helix-turn-helix transcriptional regulator [Pseudomonadota bacterium]